MTSRPTILALLTLLFLSASGLAGDATIAGDYLEARTADVYTAACFANGEVGLVGKRATMAWRVRSGEWAGQQLDGLSIVAVVRAQATLGDPFSDPLPARSVLLVDERADAAQRRALIHFARRQAGALLDNVQDVRTVPIHIEMALHDGVAKMTAGDEAELSTRPLGDHDKICGNEGAYYAPLTRVANAHTAYAVSHRFSGPGLATTWSNPSKRSVYLASFEY